MPSSRERAIQLRLQGLSRSQICDALGFNPAGRTLTRWLKDTPAPEWTKRPRAKDDLREQARAMRREGKSYREIREVVPVSKGSLSVWLADIDLTAAQKAHLVELNERGREKAAQTIRANRIARQTTAINTARAQIPEVAESELFVAGVAAYWAEGSKAKPWRAEERVTFVNSDPSMILLFLAWLRLLGVERDRLTYRLMIHETADERAAVHYWADVVAVDAREFFKSTIKRNKPQTNRKNRGEEYHGCLVVSVRRSTDLYRQIVGWWEGISASLGTLGSPSGVV